MRAGALRHKITIERPAASSGNPLGEPVGAWQTFASAWASIQPQSGAKFWGGQKAMSEIGYLVRCRYLAGVTARMRINWGGRYLQITAVMDVDGRGRELKIEAYEAR